LDPVLCVVCGSWVLRHSQLPSSMPRLNAGLTCARKRSQVQDGAGVLGLILTAISVCRRVCSGVYACFCGFLCTAAHARLCVGVGVRLLAWPDTEALNVDAVFHLARGASRLGALFTHISTDYVFDGTSPPYSVHSTPNPLVRGRLALLLCCARRCVCGVCVVCHGSCRAVCCAVPFAVPCRLLCRVLLCCRAVCALVCVPALRVRMCLLRMRTCSTWRMCGTSCVTASLARGGPLMLAPTPPLIRLPACLSLESAAKRAPFPRNRQPQLPPPVHATQHPYTCAKHPALAESKPAPTWV
jgi:hypothetical protein